MVAPIISPLGQPGDRSASRRVRHPLTPRIKMCRRWTQAAVAVLCLIVSTFAFVAGAAAAANDQPDATVSFSAGSVAVIGGVAWGTGTLHYHGRDYPFQFRGLSIGDLGFKGTWGTGEVYHMSKLEDFAGIYDSVSLGLTVAGGGTAAGLRNQKGVVMHVRGATIGMQVNLSIQGVVIQFAAK
jgi:hypothetical protein